MGKLSDARILGGIGSILQIIPFLSIVGYVLTLIAVKYISDEVHDGGIFTDMLYAVITGIIGVAVGAFVLFFAFFAAPFTFFPVGAGLAVFTGGIVFLALVWIALVVSAVFVRRAFEKIANHLNAPTFKTAGTLYLIGALLTIILIGFLVIFVAFILQIVAFFSISETAPAPQPQSQPAPQPQPGVKYCFNCGTQMASSAAFCPKCGAKQP